MGMGGIIVDQFCVNNNNSGGGQYDTSNNNTITINNNVDKKSTPSPPPSPSSSPKRNKLKLFHRRISFHGGVPLTRTSTSPYYAGPIPTGSGGAPLKSCMKKSSNLNRCNNKQVSFQCVYLRDYCRCVSDNPSVTSGCQELVGSIAYAIQLILIHLKPIDLGVELISHVVDYHPTRGKQSFLVWGFPITR